MRDEKLHSLISLEDFKAILGIDDREDKLSRSCLKTATKAIEQYCKRYFLRKKHFEWNEYNGDLLIPLREYPVSTKLMFHSDCCYHCYQNRLNLCKSPFNLALALPIFNALFGKSIRHKASAAVLFV
jgi:hypothetical protein